MSRVTSAPPKVLAPVVVSVEQGLTKLQLKAASERNGPISHYHLVVVPVDRNGGHKDPEDYTLEEVCSVLCVSMCCVFQCVVCFNVLCV